MITVDEHRLFTDHLAEQIALRELTDTFSFVMWLFTGGQS